jgi:hypothetical protein
MFATPALGGFIKMKTLLLTALFAVGVIFSCQAYTANDPGQTISSDGSYADTTAALAYVAAKKQDGWVMSVGSPGGSYVWTNTVTIAVTNIFTFQGASPTNRPTITFGASSYSAGFNVCAKNGKVVTFKDFILTDVGGGPGNWLLGLFGEGVCFRVSNVKWVNVNANNAAWVGSINSDTIGGPYGVFDHCELAASSGSFYGIFVIDNGCQIHNGWTRPMTWGTTNAVYFEDCSAHAQKAILGRAMVDGFGGARVVIRNCNVTNYSIGFHGSQSGAGDSTLQTEIYNNNIFCNDTVNGMSYVFWQRGGTGVIFSNTVAESVSQLISSGIWKFSVECASAANWQAEQCARQLIYTNDYPAPQQVGRGVVNGAEGTVPIYIWGNSVPGTYYGQSLLGYGDGDQQFIQQGRDIFTDGTVMPGYTPLVYPHPLVTSAPPVTITTISTGGSSAGPHPPSNLLAAPPVNQ